MVMFEAEEMTSFEGSLRIDGKVMSVFWGSRAVFGGCLKITGVNTFEEFQNLICVLQGREKVYPDTRTEVSNIGPKPWAGHSRCHTTTPEASSSVGSEDTKKEVEPKATPKLSTGGAKSVLPEVKAEVKADELEGYKQAETLKDAIAEAQRQGFKTFDTIKAELARVQELDCSPLLTRIGELLEDRLVGACASLKIT